MKIFTRTESRTVSLCTPASFIKAMTDKIVKYLKHTL